MNGKSEFAKNRMAPFYAMAVITVICGFWDFYMIFSFFNDGSVPLKAVVGLTAMIAILILMSVVSYKQGRAAEANDARIMAEGKKAVGNFVRLRHCWEERHNEKRGHYTVDKYWALIEYENEFTGGIEGIWTEESGMPPYGIKSYYLEGPGDNYDEEFWVPRKPITCTVYYTEDGETLVQ